MEHETTTLSRGRRHASRRRTVWLAMAAGAVLAVLVASASFAAGDDVKDQKPTPVAEINTDDDGNVRVHEQGVVAVDIVSEDLSFDLADDALLDVQVTNTPTVELDESASSVLGEIRDAISELGRGVPGGAPEVNSVEFFDFVIDNSSTTTQAVARILEFDSMLVTSLVISAENDELVVEGFNGDATTADQVFALGQGESEFPAVFSTSFPVPVRLNQLGVWCRNEAQDCEVSISLLGLR